MTDFIPNDETAICILACAAAINQELYRLIDLLNEQTRVLKRLLGKRPRPTTDERRALAALPETLVDASSKPRNSSSRSTPSVAGISV